MMEFLYFPQDKTEYIPALISLLLFMTVAVLFMRMIIKKLSASRRSLNQSTLKPSANLSNLGDSRSSRLFYRPSGAFERLSARYERKF